MTQACKANRTDLFRGAGALFIWCIPTAILIASSLSTNSYQAVIWPIALTWLGGACLVNAKRCGRRHCYLTGPFFLALALVSLLYGLGVLPLGRHGWQTLAGVLLIGSLLLTCLPEWIWGRYRSQSRRSMEERP